MAIRRLTVLLMLAFVTALGLAACARPGGLPEGPTPIPTLIPATEVGSAIEPTSPPSFTILSYPARPPSASQGESIYARNCAQCHGQDGPGAGPAARNFRDPAF